MKRKKIIKDFDSFMNTSWYYFVVADAKASLVTIVTTEDLCNTVPEADQHRY